MKFFLLARMSLLFVLSKCIVIPNNEYVCPIKALDVSVSSPNNNCIVFQPLLR